MPLHVSSSTNLEMNEISKVGYEETQKNVQFLRIAVRKIS